MINYNNEGRGQKGKRGLKELPQLNLVIFGK